ncbi:MAG: ABC transporter ATP-binding protein [Anaerolineales bacterium]|nr:ABC transporter ATP-binding protein [Anaerolineales bacterium]
MKTILKLENVTKKYSLGSTVVHALRGVNIELEKGKYYSIVGPSGSGKSTLLHILGCMDLPSTGEVWINSRPVHCLNETQLTKIRAVELGFIFQSFHLNPILTVLENVSIALQFLGIGKAAAQERAREWLDRVGLDHRLDHYPSELSGGERQRVAIARALVKKPQFVLADEPTGNLDSKTGQEIISLLRKINREAGVTIVQVTHDREIAEMGDEIISFRDGRILQ